MMRYLGLTAVLLTATLAVNSFSQDETANPKKNNTETQNEPEVAKAAAEPEKQKKKNRVRLKGDGKKDNTKALQSMVDRGNGSIRLSRGVYRITKPITIRLDETGFTSITGDGSATIVMDGEGPAIRFVGTHEGTADPASVKPNVWLRQRSPKVSGIEIVGNHAKADGIQADGTMQLTVSEVVLRKLRHGIHLVKRNRNVIISDVHVYENSGVGIFYDNVNLHQSNIIGSHISYNRMGGIVVKAGDVRNIHVGTCDIEGNMSPDGEPTANILLDSTGGSIGEVAITGCTIQHAHKANNSANIRINGDSTPRPFTPETRHGHITITGNVMSDVRVNLELINTRGVTVTGNTMWKGYDCDVRMKNCSHVILGNNMFDRNPRYHYGDGDSAAQGIQLFNCTDCSLNGNQIVATGGSTTPLELKDCQRINVTGCSILDSQQTGIALHNVSKSRISDCIIESTSSTHPSISIVGGKQNTVVSNQLSSDLESSDYSTLIDGNILVTH